MTQVLPERRPGVAGEQAAAGPASLRTGVPTIWGCTPLQVHDRFWAAFGVQVVRRGDDVPIAKDAELYLLAERDALVLFRLSQVLGPLCWVAPSLLLLRLRDARKRIYREAAVTAADRLVKFERVYRDASDRAHRVGLTADAAIAVAWQRLPDGPSPWRALRPHVRSGAGGGGRIVRVADATVYDAGDGGQAMECLREIMAAWPRPEASIRRAARLRGAALADRSARVAGGASLRGPVWIGAGRVVADGVQIAGPAVLWDDPATPTPPDDVAWSDITPSSLSTRGERPGRVRIPPGKRAFDIAFSLVALAITAPLYPFIAAAIVAEDGFPVFFAHRRETAGGRDFPCLKFRSMARSAESAKRPLQSANRCDGPQFFVPDDPRVTRVGRVLRRLHLDELPQFLNVLAGHMSVVGPRPSPYRENQVCPAWREARLSVRPGVTGLWQVSRTRAEGRDFQEWIRYDLSYVANASWALDLEIIGRTIAMMATGSR